MPKGTSKGYTSARLTRINPNDTSTSSATENQVHRMIHNSLAANFKANGLSYGQSNAELIVSYTVIYQEPGMTTQTTKYSGYNTETEKILEKAHLKGAVNSGRPDYFRQAGIVIDIKDSRTSKLIFRNVAKGDVVKGVSDSTRASRINSAVAEALAPFFKK